MNDFNSLFPHFSDRCLELKAIVTPIAYLLLTGGLISTVLATHRSGSAHFRIFGRMLMLTVLIVFVPTWGNMVVSAVDDTVKNVLRVDPGKIFDQYNAALELKKSASGGKSWFEKILDWRAAPMEWVLTAFFYYLGWVASAVMWWAYILQTAILFLGYGLSPIFIGFLAFPVLQNAGRRYLLHLAGVMAWPLGWGLAGMITEGMIDFMTDRSFLSSSVIGNDLYSLQNFMGVGFLGVWILFSTIAAPVMLQRAIQSGSAVAANLLGGAFAAGRSAFSAGTSSFVAAGAGKTGVGLVQAGAAAAASGVETIISGGLNSSGSLIGSLAHMRLLHEPGNSSASGKGRRFPKNDPTGDKTVENLIRNSRNPHSQA
ncbi:MAG: hypothetical protein SFY81_02735 [Verrucomicrobiota bacterium]|nr:hypothetical protein [Verrucomicrobiota bacterium]